MEQMARTTKSTFSSPRCRWNTNSLASCSSPGWRASVRSVHVVRHLHIPALSIHPSLATISCVLHVCVCMFVQVFFSPFFSSSFQFPLPNFFFYLTIAHNCSMHMQRPMARRQYKTLFQCKHLTCNIHHNSEL